MSRKAQVRDIGNNVVQTNGNSITEHHADNAANVIVPGKITPKFVVRPGQEQGCQAAHHACRKEGEKFGATNARRIDRYGEIREQAGDNDNKCIRKRQKTLPQSKIREKFTNFLHFRSPRMLQN